MGRSQTKEKRHRQPGPYTGAQWAGQLRVICEPKTLCRGQGRRATLLGRDDAARTVMGCATAFPCLPDAVLDKIHLLPQKQRLRMAWPSGRKPWSELWTLGGTVCRCKFITRDKRATRRGANNVGQHARVKAARTRKSQFFWERKTALENKVHLKKLTDTKKKHPRFHLDKNGHPKAAKDFLCFRISLLLYTSQNIMTNSFSLLEVRSISRRSPPKEMCLLWWT